VVAYLILAARLREELENLESVVSIARRSIDGARRQSADREVHVNSAALCLHSFYVGLERMFSAIAEEVDQQVPTGPSWHSELLSQMTYDLPSIRPAVLTTETRGVLQDYRSFRHVVRNVYVYNLDPERVIELVDELPTVFERVTADIKRFLDFLDIAGQTPVNDES
jgi:hypothetical protein